MGVIKLIDQDTIFKRNAALKEGDQSVRSESNGMYINDLEIVCSSAVVKICMVRCTVPCSEEIRLLHINNAVNISFFCLKCMKLI